MSRILFEPKRRLLTRTMLAFAIVLAIQAGVSAYWAFTAMQPLLVANIDDKLVRVAGLIGGEPLLETALDLRADDRNADQVLANATHFFAGLTPLVDVRDAFLFRVQAGRFVYLAGTIDVKAAKQLPAPVLTNVDLAKLYAGHLVVSKAFRRAGATLRKAVYVPVMREQHLLGLLAIEDDAQDLELLRVLQRQLWFTALGAFLIGGVVSYLVARTIVRPVRKLVAAAEQLGEGKFNTRFKVTGNDEINFLGQTFNDMAEDVEARDDQIRQMNEAALADARQLYEHVLRAAYSAILTANNEDVLTSENPAAEKLLGPRTTEALMTMRERLAPQPELRAFWDNPGHVPNQEIVATVGGEERVVEASIAALYDHRNQPIGRSLTLVDRTELKRLERELAMRERLAALGELAAGIAHEIRNPLNGIELMLGLVQEDLNAQGFRDERFTRIHEEVSRLNSVLNDFLLFARPKPLEKEPADLVELAEDALMLLAPAIEDRHIAVERDFDRAVPPILTDAAAMRRALVNLFKNACEAMPPHGTLYLSISGPQATGDSFQIEVRDSGPGIPDDVRERLFHPFFTTKSDGTGLGLAIVHKTIMNHNGSIACHNHPDGGACFVIRLPHAEVT